MRAKFPIPPEFDTAPSEQRIAFVQDLWDRIARNPYSVPVPDEHKRILDDRLDAVYVTFEKPRVEFFAVLHQKSESSTRQSPNR